MFLLDWYQRYKEIKHSFITCDSCDTLRSQLDVANHEKQEILKRLLDKEVPEQTTTPHSSNIHSTKGRPWPVIQRELEARDRIKAAQLREAAIAKGNAGKPDSEIINEEVEKLEKEILEPIDTGVVGATGTS